MARDVHSHHGWGYGASEKTTIYGTAKTILRGKGKGAYSVAELIKELRTQYLSKAAIDVAWIIEKLVQVVERCMEIEVIVDKSGNPTGMFRFDAQGATGALKLLAKHFGMLDKPIKLDVTDRLAALVGQIRRETTQMPDHSEKFLLLARDERVQEAEHVEQ